MDSTLQGTPVGNMVSPPAIQQQQQQQQQQQGAGGGSPAAMPPPPAVATMVEALWNSGVSVEPEDMMKDDKTEIYIVDYF